MSSKNSEIIDPRKALTLKFYSDPASETFADLANSAKRAGYSDSYAMTISNRDWISEYRQNTIDIITKAESNLKKYLDLTINLDTPRDADIDLAKLQVDVSKFVAKTLAKSKYGENEKDEIKANIQINIVNYSKNEAQNDTQSDVREVK